MAADGVVIHNYTTTFEGSYITFTCVDGFLPSDIITATCTGEGHWTTDPITYMCINTTSATTTGTTSIVINSTNANISTGKIQYCNVVVSHSVKFHNINNNIILL